MLTRILDWGAFLWRAVRLLIAGFVLAFLGHLTHAAIAAGGNPDLATVVLLAWVALITTGIVLWCMREARR